MHFYSVYKQYFAFYVKDTNHEKCTFSGK